MALEIKQANRIVVGLFPQRTDAYRAIEELREAGFYSEEIGAAFRSAAEEENWFPRRDNAAETMSFERRREDAYDGPDVTGVGSGAAGAASGTNAVTPAGLSTGAGTTTAGAKRPGPIPGSTIPHHRNRTAVDPSASLGVVDAGSEVPTGAGISISTSTSTQGNEEHRSWWQKLKGFFTPEEEKERRREGIPKDAVSYGTGAGHLPLQTPVGNPSWNDYAYDYQASEFGDLLEELGLESNSARYFARLLPPGGAVVTVHTASRATEAELIMESNQGRVRFESYAPGEVDLGEQYDDDRVVVFGEVQRAYQRRSAGNEASAEDLEGFPGRVGKLRKPA